MRCLFYKLLEWITVTLLLLSNLLVSLNLDNLLSVSLKVLRLTCGYTCFSTFDFRYTYTYLRPQRSSKNLLHFTFVWAIRIITTVCKKFLNIFIAGKKFFDIFIYRCKIIERSFKIIVETTFWLSSFNVDANGRRTTAYRLIIKFHFSRNETITSSNM